MNCWVCYVTKKALCLGALQHSRFQTPFENHATAWTATEFPVLMHLSFSRYVNDGRPFWQYIVSSSTGCSDLQYFEELYQYYTTEKVRYSVQSKWFLTFFWYIFAKLTKCDMFTRLGISAIQMLDVFLRHWGGLVSKQLSCPTLTPVFGHFYKPLNVTAGVMQLLYLLRLVSISEYSLDGLV